LGGEMIAYAIQAFHGRKVPSPETLQLHNAAMEELRSAMNHHLSGSFVDARRAGLGSVRQGGSPSATRRAGLWRPAVNGGASPERLFNSNKFQIGCGSGWDCLFPSGPPSPSRHEFPRISIRDRCEPQSVQTAPEPDFDGGY
jgi:hypothetical protein